jgi:hypothetical protein
MDAHKKNKSFIFFKMLEEGFNFKRLFFSCFEIEKKEQINTNYLAYTHNANKVKQPIAPTNKIG